MPRLIHLVLYKTKIIFRCFLALIVRFSRDFLLKYVSYFRVYALSNKLSYKLQNHSAREFRSIASGIRVFSWVGPFSALLIWFMSRKNLFKRKVRVFPFWRLTRFLDRHRLIPITQRVQLGYFNAITGTRLVLRKFISPPCETPMPRFKGKKTEYQPSVLCENPEYTLCFYESLSGSSLVRW